MPQQHHDLRHRARENGAIAPPAAAVFSVPGLCSSRAPRTKVYRNIPARESDESCGEAITVQDPAHPLFGRTFRVIRRSVHRGGGFPVSFEVEHGESASLLVPVAATELHNSAENRTKLSMEALHDLILVAEQLENHADRTGRTLGHAATGAAAPDRRRSRRHTCGDAS
jgi:hypothetical protein